MSDPQLLQEYPAALKVVGVGGGGGNAIRHLLETTTLDGIDAVAVNTDRQALDALPQGVALPIGGTVTRGLGAGADPEAGRRAAEESREALRARLAGADLMFLMAGMGGGTGSGATLEVADLAREMDILTVAVVTRPFGFEGARRRQAAQAAIETLDGRVDCLVVVPNDRLLPTLGAGASMMRAFAAVNDVLREAVIGIADVITRPGMINIDFADVAAVMRRPGRARIGTGEGMGEDRAAQAVQAAVEHPLLEATDLAEAAGVLVSITAGADLSLADFDEVGRQVAAFADEDAMLVVGTALDPALEGQLRVSIVATGLEVAKGSEKTRPAPASQAPGAPPRADTETPARPGAEAPADELLDLGDFLNRLKR
ncbi:cell division protein FtsZ [Halomonas organivorans]|uniref:Cell division protein FtsZ n=1 Tax=Halomonas organivorans TaxID=257772 RepID=A0A7W5BX05_9GAMM|nr:cell division protein FtsZ [Halomonas organivorans]MBB3140379.1 cell division protein FtsZ [Halomonas organivorans]